jgi:hypothetical protein
MRFIRRCFFRAAWLIPSLLAMAGDAKPPNPRPYVLFMGTDLAVEREKKLYRVEDVSGSEFKIHVGQQEVLIPTLNRQLTLQVSNSLKLSGAAVYLDKLHSGPAYTPENDPNRKITEAAVQAAGAEALQTQAYGQMTFAESAAGLAAANVSAGTGTPEAADASRAAFEESQQNVAIANAGMSRDMNNVGANIHRASVQLDQENFDAVEASFKVSSDIPLDDPYMIVLFKFREPDAKGNASRLLVHAKSLPPIDRKPRYIRVIEGGMTPGFKLLDCEVHIYNRGEEVPTNASTKRVELTREEARQNLAMEHASANKGATLPASAVRGTLSDEQRQRLSHEQLTRTLFAKVSKDGAVLGVYSDADCSQPLDDASSKAVTNDLFFKPALREGKPTDGVAKLRLADL